MWRARVQAGKLKQPRKKKVPEEDGFV